MKTLTVFTPTYNRAYCLHQLYESLCKQSSRDFEWLVIDDGSTDNTQELIDGWLKEKKIDIKYFYKENGGMHTGHNAAYSLVNTELNVCIDSDDFMTDNAVDTIITFWNKNKSNNYAGILGLNRYKDGSLVSSKEFPSDIKSGKYSLLKSDFGIVGDVKFIYVTEILKKYGDYPTFSGEKFVPLGYKYAIIDKDYDMLFMNETVCIVDYMLDGSTRNMFKQYYKNPRGFAFSRKQNLNSIFNLKQKFLFAIHLTAESLLAKENMFKNNKHWFISICSLPFGILLYIYIIYLNKIKWRMVLYSKNSNQ